MHHPCGINTTLESLALGVPMVAIPVGFDQAGIAARIVYHGVGKSVPIASMNQEDLSGAIQEVLGNPSYRDTARRFQKAIAQTQGLDRAADVLERAFQFVDEAVVVCEKPLDSDAHSPT
jgi:zeaxanthin glucosyltransferase